VLEANGVDVLICRVPATSSIKDRAAVLEDLISERYPGQEVNLIGHSMVSNNRPRRVSPRVVE
jgi:triacylglycerol lipase